MAQQCRSCVGVMLFYVLLVSVRGKSLEKQIMDGAPKAEMFDLFHLTPDGEVMVMTEFDLLLTWKEYKSLYAKENRPKRKARRDLATRWTNCNVYYEIDSSIIDDNDKKLIRQAIGEWEKYTCLVFSESRSNQNRIQFKDGGGCYSQLGMQSKPQPIALAPGCRTPGIIAHEIGHAIGWYHEHMRPDRDTYIKINLDSVPMRFQDNFKKYDESIINTYDIDYDYTSIMHYGTGTLPGSITTLDPEFQDKIGQREGFSFKDIKLANVMYSCAELMCPKPLSPCPYGGFVMSKSLNGSKKCECWCDSGNVSNPLILCSKLSKGPTPPIPLPPPEPSVEKLCYDVREDCAEMKEKGKCMTDMELMMDVCGKTCNFCGKGEKMCMDHEKSCKLMAAAGSCQIPALKPVLEKLCPSSCGVCAPLPPCDVQQEMMGKPVGDSHNSASSSFNVMLSPLIISFSIRLLQYI
ncbi:zinc metalloproteinase nas-13-like [Physella acuta]|uniref:zinc metalloproteinase nas-13-like n=1 Tax=Physella acuta TaxID=109671 RepID=UPI0027DE76EC|nr:zinc metalloproteinase nas-13-like [Physella acuta]